MRMTRLGQMLMDEGMELKETDSIKKLMKNMNLTIDQAINALEVPADKREKYRKTITPNTPLYNFFIKKYRTGLSDV